jgi:hypothetical protein
MICLQTNKATAVFAPIQILRVLHHAERSNSASVFSFLQPVCVLEIEPISQKAATFRTPPTPAGFRAPLCRFL